jgi:predicted metal-dependent enzyme (double-stranded beta helix superfamily)
MHSIGGLETLDAGAIDMVSPTIGDIHKVSNGSKSRASVSIHLYGGNIGAIDRHAFTADGITKQFRSGYTLDVLPNIWKT